MLILTIRTDKPEAEIGLYSENTEIDYQIWHADRQLSETILKKIDQLLAKHGKKLKDLTGIVCFSGPGSFTGLRIGISIGNALAYGLGISIVGSTKADWIKTGLTKLTANKNDKITLPKYGSLPHITKPKH